MSTSEGVDGVTTYPISPSDLYVMPPPNFMQNAHGGRAVTSHEDASIQELARLGHQVMRVDFKAPIGSSPHKRPRQKRSNSKSSHRAASQNSRDRSTTSRARSYERKSKTESQRQSSRRDRSQPPRQSAMGGI